MTPARLILSAITVLARGHERRAFATYGTKVTVSSWDESGRVREDVMSPTDAQALRARLISNGFAPIK